MGREIYDGTEKNWRIVKCRVCIRALLIFLGVILMQMLASMLCVVGTVAWAVVTGQNRASVISGLSGGSINGEFLIMVSLTSALLSMIWCGILYRKSSWREKNFDYRSAFCLKNIISVIEIGVGGCVVLTIFLSYLSLMIPQAFSSYNSIMEHLMDSSAVITIVYVLLIGPVSEEVIFRGAILDRFYLAFPFLAANVLQALLFGIYHMNLIQGLYAFCLGFVLGMIRYATGSILASVLTHILFNGTSYVLDLLFPVGQDIPGVQVVLLTIAGILLCTLGMVRLYGIYRKKAGHSKTVY